MSKECEHSYTHLETRKWKDTSGPAWPQWNKVKSFYCTKCLDEKEKKDSEYSWHEPEWYKG